MTDKNYNELLRKRVLQENREFNEELEKLPAHEALSRAYEKVIKEDLVCSISEGNLTNTEARALLRLKHGTNFRRILRAYFYALTKWT